MPTFDGTNDPDLMFGTARDDRLNGLGGDDRMIALAGNDFLDGGPGADTMEGGAGNDDYIIDHAGDVVIEAAGAGRDRVFTSVTYTLTAGQEIEYFAYDNLAATHPIDLTGNEFGNEIWGHNGANVISGAGGNDWLIGWGGADTLIGGDGDDILNGIAGPIGTSGGGADILIGGTGHDYYLIDIIDSVTEAVGEGYDTMSVSGGSYTLPAGVEIELLLVGGSDRVFTGNEFDNEIRGSSGTQDDEFYGVGGNDILRGFGGDDLLFGGDGQDLLFGGLNNDILNGDAGDDVLFGDTGNDRLDGGTGLDGMYGNAGNDTYVVDHAQDYVIELSNEGADTILASASHALLSGSHVEVLSAFDWLSTAAIDLHGNEFVNDVTGNAGVNYLSGGGGADSLLGYGGNDLLIGDDGDDSLDGGEGDDALFGSAGGDAMVGRGGNDWLEGGTGADINYGGTGNDRYILDDAGDYVFEAAGEGNDTVYTSANHTLAAGSEVELLTALDNNATAALDLGGNELANQIWGNAGANQISGGGAGDGLAGLLGDDTLIGGDGNDSLYGGGGNDTLTGGAHFDLFIFDSALGAGNVDTVTDFATGVDTIMLDDAVFAGLTPGALPPGAFVTGSAAQDSDDRIVYDSATGALSYDSDGDGAGAAVQFATLQTGLALTASDFIVF